MASSGAKLPVAESRLAFADAPFALFCLEHRAGVGPLYVDALAGEEAAAHLSGHQLAV